jgi:D-alanine transaminase
MSHVAYVNGRYVPHRAAQLSIDDRATQFADAAYEVTCIWNGRPVDHAAHLVRLGRSLNELQIAWPCSPAALTVICREIVCRNRVDRGIIYIQVSRGVAPRAHPFPSRRKPGLVVTAKHGTGPGDALAEQGAKVVAVPEMRWGRCDIKTVGLLGNVLARQQATEAKAYEALLFNPDGTVTEASASNAWMVDKDGVIITHPLGTKILGGITRAVVLKLAAEAGYKVIERPFTLDEARAGREVFLTGTTTFVMPIVQIDDKIVANGAPGTISRDLRARYRAYIEKSTASESAWAT